MNPNHSPQEALPSASLSSLFLIFAKICYFTNLKITRTAETYMYKNNPPTQIFTMMEIKGTGYVSTDLRSQEEKRTSYCRYVVTKNPCIPCYNNRTQGGFTQFVNLMLLFHYSHHMERFFSGQKNAMALHYSGVMTVISILNQTKILYSTRLYSWYI